MANQFRKQFLHLNRAQTTVKAKGIGSKSFEKANCSKDIGAGEQSAGSVRGKCYNNRKIAIFLGRRSAAFIS